MQRAIERDTCTVRQLIGRMPNSQVRGLIESLKQLSLQQLLLVRATLHEARAQRKWSAKKLDLIETLFDRWGANDLALKLVLVAYISGLSGSDEWLSQLLLDSKQALLAFGS